MENNKYLVPLAIVVAGAFISAAIYFGGTKASPQVAGNTNTADIKIPAVTAKDHIVGSRDAKLVIVEYSDTECPFCKVFHNTMKEIVNVYGGEVAWVYRHFPIASLHSRATKEAEATECAAELGGNQGFWNYINKVFDTTTSNDTLDPAQLPKIATAIGLDATAFNTCLTSGRHAEFVQDSIKEAIEAGARGTPYSVILTKNGKKVTINGAEPIANVKIKIDALLK